MAINRPGFDPSTPDETRRALIDLRRQQADLLREVDARLAAFDILPPGGTTDQALTKASDDDGDLQWADLTGVPTGGTTDQALTKVSDTDGDIAWSDVLDLPVGGTTDQALTKFSDTDGDAQWVDLYGLPVGGATDQALTKASNDDGDAQWVNLYGVPNGGTTGQTLTKASNANGDLQWSSNRATWLRPSNSRIRFVDSGYTFLIPNEPSGYIHYTLHDGWFELYGRTGMVGVTNNDGNSEVQIDLQLHAPANRARSINSAAVIGQWVGTFGGRGAEGGFIDYSGPGLFKLLNTNWDPYTTGPTPWADGALRWALRYPANY